MNRLIGILTSLGVLAGLVMADAGTITRPSKTFGGTSFVNGVVPDASDFNGDIDTIYSEFNGSISNANISATAAIAGSKLNLAVTGIMFGSGSTFSGNAVTGIVLGNSTSVPTAYTGTTCSNRFVRQLTARGDAECQQVNLASDITGTLPVANSGTASFGQNTSAWTGIPLAQSGTWSIFSAGQVLGTHNLGVAVSVASNALTIALKGADGNDPSATNPVTILHRNNTLTTGTPTVTTITAALSIVVPNTALLGTTNGVAYRIWFGFLKDGGTDNLLVFNTQGTSQLYALPNEGQTTNPATLISTGADSAGVLYSGTSASGTVQSIRWLGYIEITEATAGVWATAPTAVVLLTPGVPHSGEVVQRVYATTSTQATNDTSTLADTNLTATITPTSTINRIRYSVAQNGIAKITNAGDVRIALDRGGSVLANARQGSAVDLYGGIAFVGIDAPATTSSTTYKTQFSSISNNAQARVQEGGNSTSMIVLEEVFP